jgi:hypothetical protein
MIKMRVDDPNVDERITSLSEYYSLDVLWSGLEWLNQIVAQAETDLVGHYPEMKDIVIFWSGTVDPQNKLFNCFIWYANSATNFLKLLEKTLSPEVKVLEDFSQLFTWRNKVASHFSYVEPRRDSEAIKISSIMQSIEISQGRYCTGQLFSTDVHPTLSTDDPGIWNWSLTRTHIKIKDFRNNTFQEYLSKVA